MGVLKIFTFPDTVLAKKASPIERVEKDLHKLADDMLETMYYAPGIGLAANQVGVLKRFIVVDTDYDYDEAEGGKPVPEGAELINGLWVRGKRPKILINPKIIYTEGETQLKEACLSVPDFSAEVKRADKIKVEYQDIDGLTKVMDADGLLAVCLQHEMDHLDGKLFIDRLSFMKRDLARKQLIKDRAEREDEDR